MIKNRLIQLIYRVIFVSLSFIGTLNSFGLLGGTINLDCLVYYTNLSNYLCFIVMFIVVVSTYKHIKNGDLTGNNTIINKLKFYSTIIILVTFLVYNILLTDNMFGRVFDTFKYKLSNLLRFYILCI